MSDTAPKRTRVRRPDTAVEDQFGDILPGVPVDDADVSDADMADDLPDAAVDNAGDDTPNVFIAPEGPFTTSGITVYGKGGKPVCLVASPHQTLERRQQVAAWIADRLNG